jgi:hypothetical protein
MSNYIDDIAKRIFAKTDPDTVPDENDMALSRIYAVLALAKGTETTLKDVHDAWSAWRSALDPKHKSLVEMHILDYDTQMLDRPYCKAIVDVAFELKFGAG